MEICRVQMVQANKTGILSVVELYIKSELNNNNNNNKLINKT